MQPMTERRWHEIWMEQCEAPAAIRVRYGVESSFLYLHYQTAWSGNGSSGT